MINPQVIPSEIEQQRQEFPGLNNKVYFNFGGQGTLPRSGLEAIIDAHKLLQQQGPFSLKVNAWINQKVELLRQDIANEFSVTASTITLTENVTSGCNIVLWGIDWQTGDRLLMTDCEHPGVIAIVQEISRRFGVEIDICPILNTLNEGDPVAVIEQHLTPKTRLVLLSNLLWNTGQVLPLTEIVNLCHNYPDSDRPISVLVDAAQSAGSLALNLAETGVDFYAFTGHKWFCGPAGVGGLYIRPESFKLLHPTFIGWRGIDQDEKGQPIGWKVDGRRFEVATSAYPQYEGLRAAIAVHQDWGNPKRRYLQICELSAYLWQNLAKIEGVKCLKKSPPEAGLVSFQVDRNISHAAIVQQLENQGFLLRTILNPDCIRACVHYFTLPAEIEQLVGVIQGII
ncbi:aminotransferase class V-fold PLP-dependent enzyme [Crocosphaera sp. XPORK-15E]|uniref:aminotransferase class V-fold PLP-dependent enzyme n=1 Tax=Crocosphaera sp. XPORK-15E TaxID=3110247 RepID=UPI002B1F01C7|nr:aminotransferase class V-fold PLP-dependent enzyme [Crocosphaera sp. XPORK-15E]MEA5532797.1 aminotransferase class V-fold PLP-dependent enzyme [Crocosphaera sp. XPORK-15E]